MDCSGPAKYNMWFGPALRYRNRGKYRTADTACFSKITKNIATALFGYGIAFKPFYTFLHLFKLFFFTKYRKILQNTAGIIGITGIETGKE